MLKIRADLNIAKNFKKIFNLKTCRPIRIKYFSSKSSDIDFIPNEKFKNDTTSTESDEYENLYNNEKLYQTKFRKNEDDIDEKLIEEFLKKDNERYREVELAEDIEKDSLLQTKIQENVSGDKLLFRNFKSLYEDAYISMTYLLNEYSMEFIESLCQIFVENIFQIENSEDLVSVFKELVMKKMPHLNESLAMNEAKKIQNSFFNIWEFLDRGMKGFLTGDISYHLLKNGRPILEKYKKELEKVDKDLACLGIEPHEFYKVFFEINRSFFKNNGTSNLVLDLRKQFENQGVNYNKLLYFVNLKCTQFTNNNKIETLDDKSRNLELIIDEKKNLVQQLFNDMYNELNEISIVNVLKTPFYGIKFPGKENKHNLFRRQLLIEEGTYDRANEDFINIFNSLQDIGSAHEMFCNKTTIIEWHGNLQYAIAEYQKLIIDGEIFNKKNYEFLKYFNALPSNQIAIICLLHFLKIIINNLALKPDEHKTEEKFLKILKQIDIDDDEYAIDIPLTSFSEDLGNLFFTELRNSKIENTFKNSNAVQYFKNLSINVMNYEITRKEKIKLGLFITNILVRKLFYTNESCNKDEKLRVLKIKLKRISEVKSQNFVSVEKDFVSRYFQDLQKTFSLNIQVKKSLPMIYPPMPWKNFKIGSLYLRQTYISKITTDHYEASFQYERNNISKVMSVLDKLGNVKWRINKQILDVVEYVWATGGGKAYVPKRFNERIITLEMLKNERGNFKEKIKLLKESQDNRELHSLRCDFSLKMQIAREYANCSEIYYPHNIDYRGRAYPISPHLNHLGSDINRGLLEYAEAKPLGKTGLKWMKIHLANNIGKDKLPLDQREKYIDSIIDTIHKCAKDPYKNLEWIESENPWQTLASMFEISNALNSSNPEEYKTHLHVHVDGSCNGLQHYSALSRDYNGGSEVNLVNKDCPGDVYTKVLEIVLQKINNETNPNDIKYAELLRASGIVTRKVVKQTVMTSVYGVTLVGARDQIKKQLKEKNIFDPQTLFYVSMYLAKKTMESIGDLFKEANQIKAWLTKCALIISQSGNTVKWITPLGLPCIQPYKKLVQNDIIKTHAQGVVVISNYDNQPVNKKKQGSAFPPNYIHSLDSCHMMLTCLKAVENGIVFSSVHDSFWSHPSDIDLLNRYIREEFVKLYSEPLLENLLNNFKSSFPELKFPDIPQRGNLDLKEVLNSTYFFS